MNIKKFSFISLALVTGLGALFTYVSFMSDANENNEGEKAIIIGASSGIGKEVAKLLAKKGFNVGLVGRRTHLLKTLQHEIPTKSYVKTIDIAKTEEAISLLNQLIDQMGGLDVMIIMAGAYSQFNPDKEWDSTKNLIDVDIKGFSAMALTAIKYFEKQKSGHLVGVSSIAALRGVAHAPSYSAVKAYASILLEGLRNRMIQKNIPAYVTELIPGWGGR